MKFYLQLFSVRRLDDIVALANDRVFHWRLEKIIEITYSYRELWKNIFLNETLFEEYSGLSYPENSLTNLWKKVRQDILLQIRIIQAIVVKTRKMKILSRSDTLRRWLFVESLEYIENILQITLLGLDFELEKAGVKHKLTKAQVQKRIRNIEHREKVAFWLKVSEKKSEAQYCYNFIVLNHEKKKKRLSVSDKRIMKKSLTEIKKKINPAKVTETQIQNKQLRNPILKRKIHRKDYRKIFDAVCEFYDLAQRTKITNAWSIYDGDNFLEIPRNDAHAIFTVERLLKLITHEIESHYINTHNGQILLWKFRGASNLPKEEWLAMFMERILQWYNYDSIHSIIEYFFTTLAGEVLTGKDFSEFMRIMWKEYKCKRNYEASVIRAKRNYDLNFPWVQHKDVVYFRWLMQVKDYLQKWGKFWKLFLWKVSFEDLDNITILYDLSERKKDLIFPVFMSDAILFYFSQKQKDKKYEFSIPEYYLYLRKKYWFLGIENFWIIEYMQINEKKFLRICKMLEKSILKEE